MTTLTRTQVDKTHVFLTRGVIAIAWAAVFAAVAKDLDTNVTVGPARRLLLGNAATSTLAAVALAVAATGTVANVLAVFGVWAAVSGAAQLVTALRRRSQSERRKQCRPRSRTPPSGWQCSL